MSPLQQTILEKILADHHIGFAGAGLIRLRDGDARPVMNVPQVTWNWFQKWQLLRKRGRVWVVNRKTIRSLHGNSAIKRLYKGKPVTHKTQNTPPPMFDDNPARWDQLFSKIEKLILWPN